MAIPRSESRFTSDDINFTYSSEDATSYRDRPRTSEKVSGRQFVGLPGERPSLVRIAKMRLAEDIKSLGADKDCETGKFVVSDRIRLSIRAKEASGPGDFDVEIHSCDGVATRLVFRGRFNFDNVLSNPANTLETWIATITGDPCHEWIVGISYEPAVDAQNQNPQTVEMQVFAIVDRAGCAPGGGDASASPSIQVNRDALVSVTAPTPSGEFATQLSIVSPAYTLATPDVVVPFTPDNVSLAFATAAAAEVWVSFDGATDHIHMINGTPTSSFTMPSHRRKWWLRAVAGTPVPVQVLATQDRDF